VNDITLINNSITIDYAAVPKFTKQKSSQSLAINFYLSRNKNKEKIDYCSYLVNATKPTE
jgi:hypothetical protein